MNSQAGTKAAVDTHSPSPHTPATHTSDTHATASRPAQDKQRLPSPPTSVLQQKRRLPGGKNAHNYVDGGKSIRVGEVRIDLASGLSLANRPVRQQQYAHHLRLQDPAYQVCTRWFSDFMTRRE